MSYQHYERIGDIWKHLPLCNFLNNENPRYSIETNSAFPWYALTHSKHDVIINPGVVDCGVAIGNLSQRSIDEFNTFNDELTTIYRNSIIDGNHSGQLRKESFSL